MPLSHRMPGHLIPADVLGGAGEFWHYQQVLLPCSGVDPLDEGGDSGAEGGDIAGSSAHGVGGVPQEPFQWV